MQGVPDEEGEQMWELELPLFIMGMFIMGIYTGILP